MLVSTARTDVACRVDDLVLISWDGRETPLRLLRRDQPAAFQLLLFDYSGRAQRPDQLPVGCHWLSRTTLCKGEIFSALVLWLKHQQEASGCCYRYIGLIDDDVAISLGQINQALVLAAELGSICFSPTLAVDISGFVPHMVSRSGGVWRQVVWVDSKMSFVRSDLFFASAPFYPLDYSSYGVARFIHPYWSRVLNLAGGFHVFDEIVVKDCRPHRSGSMVFPNGLTGLQEARRLHRVCLRHVQTKRPDLLSDTGIRELLVLPPIAPR